MEAKKYMDQGLLVPDELTVKILLDRVARADISSIPQVSQIPSFLGGICSI